MNDALDMVIFDTKLKAERDYWLQRVGSVPTLRLATGLHEADNELRQTPLLRSAFPAN